MRAQSPLAQASGSGWLYADRSVLAPPRPLPSGFDAIVDHLAGAIRRLPVQVRRLRRLAEVCADRMAGLQGLSEAELQVELQTHREAFRLDMIGGQDALLAALAAIGEVSGRELGLRPYPVQLMGALALHQGWLAEMATGEGKTLTVAMAAVLAGWSGRPCHLVTANDYLAARDALEMGPLYRTCGVSVVAVTGDLLPQERAARYASDVVYVTAKELLADFLRDRQAASSGSDVGRAMMRRWLWREAAGGGDAVDLLLVRGLHTALIDEADSVLIDEAVTPLILSSPRPDSDLSQAVLWASEVADRLVAGADYEISRSRSVVSFAPEALELATRGSDRLPRLWQAQARREELLRQALVARHFMLRDQHYVLQDGKIVLLDEGTGRLTPSRTLTAGLQQAVEAHEGLAISDPSQSLGQMSFQAFFRCFRRLAGTTGTAHEARSEFWSIYGLGVLAVPTHRPRIRRAARPRVLASEAAKTVALLAEIERLHAQGLPVLVGLRSVKSSDRLAEQLRARGLPFRLLNAVRLGDEAEIVAQAGQVGRITVATNMAGRGTDIVLGPGVAAMGGLQVIVAECNESVRIDRQLAGRCGRQGDPGRVSTWLSIEDPLLQRYLPARWCLAMERLARHSSGWAEPLINAFSLLLVRLAKRNAEAQARQRRRSVLEADEWMNKALPFDI
jgi:preprotein translocase subunit SecA